MRVLGIDPGLTRCGIGLVEVDARAQSLVRYDVFRTPAGDPIEQRLLTLGRAIDELLDTERPDAVALERVFAQQNLHTVMGVAQLSGIVLRAAAERGIPIAMLTPSEVKGAVTGYGAAEKAQVAEMVRRILGLAQAPKPADAADALALAIAHGRALHRRGPAGGNGTAETPAQAAWRAAEARARRSGR